MEELGKKLLEQRQARGISLQEISAATHISVGVLKDIENGNFDKYVGDEEYIKKYIKKYADYLKIESADLIDSYVTLTHELSLSKIQEREKKVKNEVKKPTATITKPTFARTSKVYDNHSGRTFVKYTVIAALCLLIIFSVWYGLKLTKNSNDDFGQQNQTHVSGNLENTPSNDEPVTPPNSSTNAENEEPKVTQEEKKIEVEHTGAYQYTIKLPSDIETFNFKIDFVAYTWSSLRVNGQVHEGFNDGVFNVANTANDKNASPETVTLSLNKNEVNTITLRNGCNLYHRYYVNDTEIPVPDSEQTANVADLTFTFVKE